MLLEQQGKAIKEELGIYLGHLQVMLPEEVVEQPKLVLMLLLL
jgi:hypothetical protein